MRFLLAIVLSFLPVALFAERSCIGLDCESLERNYGGFLDSFEKIYVPQLTRDMFKAQAATHTASVPHIVSLNKMAIGWYGTVGLTDTQKIDVFDPSKNQYKRMNEFGFALGHNLYAGVNVGWLFALTYNLYLNTFECDKGENVECNYEYEFPLLSRIELYVNGIGKIDKNIQYNYTDTYYGNRNDFSNFGYMVRFQIIQEKKILFDIIKFPGLSTGAGYQRSRVDFARKINDINLGFKFDELKYEWQGENIINYRSDVETKMADVRTGIKFFDFILLYFGAGIAYSKGGVFISLYKNGTYTVANQPSIVSVHMKDSYFNNNYIHRYYTAGVSIGGFTVQGTSTFGRTSIDARKNFSVTVGFTAVLD